MHRTPSSKQHAAKPARVPHAPSHARLALLRRQPPAAVLVPRHHALVRHDVRPQHLAHDLVEVPVQRLRDQHQHVDVHALVPLLQLSPRLSASCSCASVSPTALADQLLGGDHTALIDEAAVDDAATVMIRLGRETEGGYGNFRFCATFGCPPGIAFFPAAYAGDEAEEGGDVLGAFEARDADVVV